MWHFRRKGRGEKIRDPIQGEFFAIDAIDNPAQALIRESIQNSLDARAGGPVTVRIYFSGEDDAVPWSQATRFLLGAWPHFAAERNGLREAPLEGEPCQYLTVEDFGTSGLIGDPAQSDHVGPKNPFFLFFRAEGRSDKVELDRGRWGVGKFVFPRSSRISTHFGLTNRRDDSRSLLLGAATLKSHSVDGISYCPDGLFGVPDCDDFVLPIEDEAVLAVFRKTFSIGRQDEPGLSVVVPYVDPEITFDRLVSACAVDYFLPILEGSLTVRLESPNTSLVLESGSLERALGEFATRSGQETARYVELARWGSAIEPGARITLDPASSDGGVPRWEPDLLRANVLEVLREKLRNHEKIAVRVPLIIRPKVQPEATTYFDILLEPDRNADGRPVFARAGIVISDIRAPRAREIRSLVLVKDKPLVTFLGDSENPAHTQWQKDGSNFRGRYKYGAGTLEFVISGVANLMKLVNSADDEQDASLTVDFFSLDANDLDDTEKGTDKKKRRPRVMAPAFPPEPSKPPALAIRRHVGGFRVTAGLGVPDVPFDIEIYAAYDTRDGNPLKRYHTADFDFALPAFPVAVQGASITLRLRNALRVRAEDRTFAIDASGFDEARDLYIRANVSGTRGEEQGDASPQT